MRKLLIFNDTSRYQHYGCDLVMESLLRNLRSRGQLPVCVHRVGTSVEKRFDRIMERHPDAAAIIVNGEGVIHHDRKHAKGLAALAGRAAALGLPAYLINAALFENSAALYRDLAHYKAVYVRDGESQREAQQHGIDAQRVPDLSFDGIAGLALADQKLRSGMLVTDSVHPELTIALKNLAAQDKADWLTMQRRIALPLRGLREAGAHRFVRRVAASEQMLTGRFHAVTTCIATRTPFLALASNTRKIEAILHDVFGNESRMAASITTMTEQRRQQGLSFTTDERAAIESYLMTGAEATRQMFDRLAIR